MAEMEDKINSILSDPKMMQQIMSMAQALGGDGSKKEDPPPQQQGFSIPEIDMATVQKITGLARQSGIDKREQSLLRALGGYLSKDRVARLEKAMRAAKMAKIATSALGQRGITPSQGR